MKNTRTISANHTLGYDDNNYHLLVDSASAVVITIPKNSTVPIPVGLSFTVSRMGTGKVSISAETGATVRAKDGMFISEQYGEVTIKKLSEDLWVVTGDVPDFREYVALLTQSGGDGPSTATSGTLTVGVYYEITTYVDGDDFTNVGAASNATGVKFFATGTTPAVWTESSEVSFNTGSPIAVVLKNTLGGEVVWTRNATGVYYATLTGAFASQKTVCQVTPQGTDGTPVCGIGRGTDNFVALGSVASGVNADSLLNNTPVFIKVYN